MNAASLFLALSAAATPADTERAKDLYDAGGEAYRRGQYEVAIRAFEEASRLAPRPAITFSLAQAYRLQYFVDGDAQGLARAVALYRTYLSEAPEGGRRDHAAEHLATLAPIMERVGGPAAARPEMRAPGADPKARLIVSSRTENASARIDGSDPRSIPATFEVAAGSHRLVVEAAEHLPKTVETVAVSGSVVALNVELDPMPGLIGVRSEEDATVILDGRTIGTSPIADPIEVPAGIHVLAAIARGREPFVQQVQVGRGQALTVDAELEVSGQRVASYVLFAGTGALLAGAGALAGLALQKESQAFDAFDPTQRSRATDAAFDERTRLIDDRDTFARTSIALAAAGGAAGVSALLLWLLDMPDAPRVPMVAPTPGGAAVQVGF